MYFFPISEYFLLNLRIFYIIIFWPPSSLSSASFAVFAFATGPPPLVSTQKTFFRYFQNSKIYVSYVKYDVVWLVSYICISNAQYLTHSNGSMSIAMGDMSRSLMLRPPIACIYLRLLHWGYFQKIIKTRDELGLQRPLSDYRVGLVSYLHLIWLNQILNKSEYDEVVKI